MASEIGVKLVIGAAVSGAFQTVLGGARKTVDALGEAARRVEARHARLGEVMARAMTHPARPLAELRQRYETLGRTLDQIRAKSDALSRSLSRGEALKAAREQKLSAMRETAGAALAVGAPVIGSIKAAVGLEDLVRDIAITGEMTRAEEAKLSAVLRQTALDYNQRAADIGQGLQALVASGITSSDELARFAPVLAKAATATRASVDDLSNTFVTLKNNLGIQANEAENTLNMLAYAGKQGQFELRDMARWLPNLAPMMQSLGVTGKEAVAELGAALQIARKGAGTSDAAANNLRNFLAKVTAPDTLKDFEKAGIDLKASLIRLRGEGMTPMMAMLEIIRDYMRRVGGEGALKKFDAAANAGDMAGMQALSESYGLGELFQDVEAMSFVKPAIANLEEFKKLKAETLAAGGQDMLGEDFDKRMAGAGEQMKRLGILVNDIGLSVGEALLPPLVEIAQAIAPVARAVGQWARENPLLVKTIVGLGLALTAGKLAVLGLGWAVNFLALSPFNALKTAIIHTQGRWLALRALMQTGAFSGMAARAAALAGVLGGVLKTALMGAGRALLWLGRAVMLNPIGLALTAAALLVYKFWGPIKGFFKGLWDGITAGLAPVVGAFRAAFAPVAPLLDPVIGAFKTVIGWVGRLVSGVGDLLKPMDDAGGAAEALGRRVGQAIASAAQMFLSLPGKLLSLPGEMLRIGGEVVAGLINGIKNKLASAGNAIEELGESIKSRFKGWLGIKSPSRVFADFGQMIGLGAAQGIAGMAGAVGKATAGLALAATTAFQPALALPQVIAPASAPAATVEPIRLPEVPDVVPALHATKPAAGATASAARTGAPAAMQITFAPVIHVNGGGSPAAVREQVSQAMQMSFAEFERLMRRYEAERRRIAPGGGWMS
ncbi:phage tail tape measure protein [Tepidimonas taiwanensis]|uniref:phage tail tape measure protein n=1 Tax=Tepidimonas taiwanensis TaxID=307486 RepID=UPI0007340562|nr:phage tail tape measure protein [Tepidimonas taiwanensis]